LYLKDDIELGELGGSQGFPENENDMTQTSKLTILKDMVPVDLMDMVDIMVGIWWIP
jgi:hypothetical protein